MSLKRRLENQYQRFAFAVRTTSFPDWLSHPATRIGLAVVVLFFGVLYLLQISTTSTGGYAIRDLEKKVDTLSTEIQKVQIAVAEESAMPSIQKRLLGANMVKVEKIKFVNPVGGSVALR